MAKTTASKENIIQLMGKENKKQAKKAHQSIRKAFKNESRGNGKTPE